MFPPDISASLPMLVFGAHPDDIEFGCGGVVARETSEGRAVHFLVCSRGEAATNGTPESRVAEAASAAKLLGATVEILELDGDARLEVRSRHAVALGAIIRKIKPGVVLAPTLIENQHPDHFRLGQLVRDACRLARYGGVTGMGPLPAHAVGALLFYAVTPEAEPLDRQPILVDISAPEIITKWTAAMEAHASQGATRPYAELQIARARVWGLRAGVESAQALYPNDPLVFRSLAALTRSARRF